MYITFVSHLVASVNNKRPQCFGSEKKPLLSLLSVRSAPFRALPRPTLRLRGRVGSGPRSPALSPAGPTPGSHQHFQFASPAGDPGLFAAALPSPSSSSDTTKPALTLCLLPWSNRQTSTTSTQTCCCHTEECCEHSLFGTASPQTSYSL